MDISSLSVMIAALLHLGSLDLTENPTVTREMGRISFQLLSFVRMHDDYVGKTVFSGRMIVPDDSKFKSDFDIIVTKLSGAEEISLTLEVPDDEMPVIIKTRITSASEKSELVFVIYTFSKMNIQTTFDINNCKYAIWHKKSISNVQYVAKMSGCGEKGYYSGEKGYYSVDLITRDSTAVHKNRDFYFNQTIRYRAGKPDIISCHINSLAMKTDGIHINKLQFDISSVTVHNLVGTVLLRHNII
ncbi:uncharacterized protein LOC143078414 [Mytilus galloprovincialis]|uniref:uncharacterized protein LOC143078414 n=1 Tax=Mytilus galloprovincialis TaxID=29158 RepID=UPI003F7B9E76